MMLRQCKVHIGVMITTFRRPMGLLRTIESLIGQQGDFGTYEIHVIDNDCDQRIETLILDICRHTGVEIYYHAEKRRGVASARNHALTLVKEEMDYMAFIDDDEAASPLWLKSLVDTAQKFNVGIVQGPVEPIYEGDVANWFHKGRVTALGPFRDGQELRFGYSGNVLLSTAIVLETGLRFDPRFDRSGGEDQHFFMGLMAMGHRIIASRDAIVFETIPVSRLSLKEYIRRRFRIGATLTLAWRLLRVDRRILPYRILVGAGHAGFGFLACLVPWHWFSSGLALHIGRIAYGFGQIAGAGGYIGSSYTTIHQERGDRIGDYNHG
jgi:succinoglycan biosynthesis protein ExoM